MLMENFFFRLSDLYNFDRNFIVAQNLGSDLTTLPAECFTFQTW